jgi:RimJ/RimL family protein N-acetyltransferase
MKVSGFDIELLRLRKEHIELLRYWRNHPDISVFMDYQTFITEEMQMKWYKSLDVARDFYFIIAYKGKDIGMIHLSDVDWSEQIGKAGLFIWDQQYWNTQVPVFASISLISFAFDFLKLKTLEAKVMKSNPAAIKYNTSLGFKVFDETESYKLYKLQNDDADFNRLKSRLSKLSKKQPLAYEITKSGYNILQALPEVAEQMSTLLKNGQLSLKS